MKIKDLNRDQLTALRNLSESAWEGSGWHVGGVLQTEKLLGDLCRFGYAARSRSHDRTRYSITVKGQAYLDAVVLNNLDAYSMLGGNVQVAAVQGKTGGKAGQLIGHVIALSRAQITNLLNVKPDDSHWNILLGKHRCLIHDHDGTMTENRFMVEGDAKLVDVLPSIFGSFFQPK